GGVRAGPPPPLGQGVGGGGGEAEGPAADRRPEVGDREVRGEPADARALGPGRGRVGDRAGRGGGGGRLTGGRGDHEGDDGDDRQEPAPTGAGGGTLHP